MSELVTLNKKDPRFRSYIEGTFSKELRALPIHSLNVNTEAEQVTFRLQPRSEIRPPFSISQWFQILKVRNLLFVAFPAALVFMKNWGSGSVADPVTGTFSVLAAFSLMTAVSLRNDYLDHLSGLDRLHPNSGSHAIQRGLVTASEVKKWSSAYLFAGVLLGSRALWLYPKILILIGVLAVLGVFGLNSFSMGLKYRRWTEWSAFLLLGPLLTTGIQLSFGGSFNLETVWIGCLTGWLSVFYLHLKNFGQLMVNDQAQFQNTMTWLGFEKGRYSLLVWWLIFIVGLTLYQGQTSTLSWQILILAGSVLATVPFWKAVLELKSPLGSQMKQLIRSGHWALRLTMALWALQALWSSWMP